MSASENSLLRLESYETYGSSFMNLEIWEPFVARVCQRHNLPIEGRIRPGLAGTYPTFIAADRWVVKFFGPLFDGASAYQAEWQANQLVAQQANIPTAAIIAAGKLFDYHEPRWPWPYLIFEFIPGVSIGEVYKQVRFSEKLALARQLGDMTRDLHHLKLEGFPSLSSQGWKPYCEFLDRQRSICVSNHRKWNSLPEKLIIQIENFLLPSEEIIDFDLPPALIHADITRDHILGQIKDGCWETQALIDFGDAMIGDVFYELVALHFDTFQFDRRLLKTYLDVYGLSDHQQQNFPRKAMSVALLHPFNVLHELPSYLVESTASLETLAYHLWKVNPQLFTNEG